MTRLGFTDGLRSLPRAVGVLFRAPRILLWLLPPFLITLILDVLAFYFAFGWIRDGIDKLVPDEGWLAWLATTLDVLGAVAVVFLLGWSFTWLFLTLTSPFHDHISAAVERESRGFAGPEPEGLDGFFKSIFRSALHAIVLALLTVVFLVLNFIPLVGSVLFFLWTTFVLGYSFIAVPSGRMAHSFTERLSLAQQNRRAVMGLGFTVFLASLVPILNLLFMPIFVVAGTLLHLDASAATGQSGSGPDSKNGPPPGDCTSQGKTNTLLGVIRQTLDEPDHATKPIHAFDRDPIWGGIYYPHFRRMIHDLTR